MARMIPLCVVLLALPFRGSSDEPPRPTETVIRLEVQAAPAPKPALRYQLLPELREMSPGNAVPEYLKCFSGQNPFFYGKQALEERLKWEAMPLKDLPVAKLRDYGGIALRQADYAARFDHADWQALARIKRDGVHLLLPEIQQMRELTRALKLRFRGEVADRRFDDALVTAKTMFALARALGEQPTLIGNLVGNAIAYIATGPLEEMMQQPGCPNLFWALTDLPQPFIDFRKGLQGERIILTNEFGMLDEKTPMTEPQLQNVVDRFQALLSGRGGEGQVRDWLANRTKDRAQVLAARKRLVEYGLAEDKVKGFSALHVVFLDEKLTYEEQRDEALKGMMLPYWQAEPWIAASLRHEESPFARLVPRVAKLRGAQTRLEKRFALLRCVEALRLHAAEHGGNLPAKLADVKLPLPVDPTNGQPFLYSLEAGAASLRGATPPGMEKNAFYNIRYEVSIRK